MTYDIKLDLAELDALASDLGTIIDEFEEAGSHADEAAESTGSRVLADKVRSFESSWDIRRGKMVEDIKSLQQNITTIAETFVDADADLATSLEDAGSNEPTPVGPGLPKAV
ncbi:MAG: hypothetical protein GX593_10025 [Actinomycetales bacterium]|nr:hypothetical protein [Actinomycetales bacterium]